MARQETDGPDIDGLIHDLTINKPAVSSPHRGPSPIAPIPLRRAVRERASLPDIRDLMPSLPTRHGGRGFAISSALSLPALPDVRRYFRLPGPVAVARMWAGLSLMLGVAMIFWPYPKTYLWGIESYLASLGVVLLGGVWGARLSWDARLGSAHTLAILTAFWAVVLAAAEALPLL